MAGPEFDALTPAAFAVPGYQEVRRAIDAAGGVGTGMSGAAWIERVAAEVSDERIRSGIHALAVEPLRAPPEPDAEATYAAMMLARLHEIVTGREIVALKSKLQRMNPLENPDAHARLFGELIALEGYRRTLRERALGSA
jgi:DNA primase